MVAVHAKMSGPAQRAVNTLADHFTHGYREPSMPNKFIAAQSGVRNKRARLKEIVSRMGPDATPAAIREEAYRVGFGAVNSALLIFVRNELWPERERHSGGSPKGCRPTELIAEPSGAGPIACPSCGSERTLVKNVYRRQGARKSRTGERLPNSVWRSRECARCQFRFGTVSNPGETTKNRRRLLHIAATEKECSKCRRVLPVSCFGKREGDYELYRSSCKECSNRARAEAGHRNNLKRHGMTPETYDAMLQSQQGLCAICKKPGNGKGQKHRPLCIDHCHTSGKVRGLLCDRCNLGLGNFDDDIGLFQRVIEYLRRDVPEVS